MSARVSTTPTDGTKKRPRHIDPWPEHKLRSSHHILETEPIPYPPRNFAMRSTTVSRAGALLLLFPSVTSGNLFDGNLRGRKNFWYVDYSLGTQGQCVKSCVPSRGSFCGGVHEFWEEVFPTADKCCEKMLWWMPKTQCKRQAR